MDAAEHLAFDASLTYVGERQGFVFTTGWRGTGYYADGGAFGPHAVGAAALDASSGFPCVEGELDATPDNVGVEEAKIDSLVEGDSASDDALVQDLLRAYLRMHVQSHNIAHYTGDYSTKFAEQTGTLLGNLAAGVERYESGCGSVAPRANDAAAGDVGVSPVDSYVHKRATWNGVRSSDSWKDVVHRGYRLLIRLQTSANRTIIKKLTEINFQLRYGHECYLSHRTWTLFTRRPVTLAFFAYERRRRKRVGENYESLNDYVVPTGPGSKEDENSGNNKENGLDDRCLLRAHAGAADEDGEDAGEDDGAVRQADNDKCENKRQDDGEEPEGVSARPTMRMARMRSRQPMAVLSA